MNEVPPIGGARGVFEIFVPGVFLLSNIVGAIYLFPWTSGSIIRGMNHLAANSAVVIVITVCFGYLCGVVLRLLRADIADDASARWNRCFNPRARREKDHNTGPYWSWATEDVPFIGWIGEMCDIYLPPEARDYYEREWATRVPDAEIAHKNKQFLNLCKVAISKDPSLGAEVYAAEAMTRYVVCMFYALVAASALAAGTAVLSLIHSFMTNTPFAAAIGTGVACSVYVLAGWLIVKNLRFVRLKEVETLFYACYVKKLQLSHLEVEGHSAGS